MYGAALDDRLEAIKPMISDGWTTTAALDHLEGSCDPMVCCGFTQAVDPSGMFVYEEVDGHRFPIRTVR